MQMNHRADRLTLSLPVLALLTAIGCSSEDSRDERLAEATRGALEQQSKQNEYIASQATSVAEQSKDVTETAKELVQSDAEARREMIDATTKLHGELHTERRNIDRQHEKLDDERKQIAAERHRDPIIAVALEGFGLILACLMPLVVCVLVLRQMRDETGDERALGEMLALEIASDQPTLLPASPFTPARLPAQGSPASLPRPTSEGDAAGVDDEPPF